VGRWPMAELADEEHFATLPPVLGPVIDAHVHLFPDRVFGAIWRWFEQHGWPVRYQLHASHVLAFLKAKGFYRVVGLSYSHVPEMARSLNAFMAGLAREHPILIPLATVLPGEPEALAILEEASQLGLRGIKLHCHVQCFAPDSAATRPIYEYCERHEWPLVIHAGLDPKSEAHRCDVRELCGVERIARVLAEHPRLKLVVPHLGADEFEEYGALLERHDNLWLDTAMMFASYFEARPRTDLLRIRPDRILYGSDFPNLPYAWDRELRALMEVGLSAAALQAIMHGNARELYAVADK